MRQICLFAHHRLVYKTQTSEDPVLDDWHVADALLRLLDLSEHVFDVPFASDLSPDGFGACTCANSGWARNRDGLLSERLQDLLSLIFRDEAFVGRARHNALHGFAGLLVSHDLLEPLWVYVHLFLFLHNLTDRASDGWSVCPVCNLVHYIFCDSIADVASHGNAVGHAGSCITGHGRSGHEA